MSLESFQSLLTDLYLRKAFRDAFLSAPSKALKGRDLTDREKRALAGINRARLERFCEGLAVKNSLRLQAAFRRTSKLLGKRFEALCREYGDRHSDLREWPEKLESFANLLLCALRGDGLPAHARELARFEYVKAALNCRLDKGLDASSAKKLGLTRRPAGWVGTFSCDVLRPASKSEGPVSILFRRVSRYRPIQTTRLESPR